MGSGYNLDPAKIGQEGYNLLKYYEQQLKALQVRSMTSVKSVMILGFNFVQHAQNIKFRTSY